LIWQSQHRKRCFKTIFLCRGNVFTEPLPSNDRSIHIQTHRLMGGIYEVCRWDVLRCHGIHTKFRKDPFRNSKIIIIIIISKHPVALIYTSYALKYSVFNTTLLVSFSFCTTLWHVSATLGHHQVSCCRSCLTVTYI
jgi:hypothetical protein